MSQNYNIGASICCFVNHLLAHKFSLRSRSQVTPILYLQSYVIELNTFFPVAFGVFLNVTILRPRYCSTHSLGQRWHFVGSIVDLTLTLHGLTSFCSSAQIKRLANGWFNVVNVKPCMHIMSKILYQTMPRANKIDF